MSNIGSGPLLALPLELWYHILDLQPDPGKVCGPLSLACQTFRDLFQPLLFRATVIEIPYRDSSHIEKQLAFLQTERILPFIKRCHIEVTGYFGMPFENKPSPLHHQAFHTIFPQLEFISFRGITFHTEDLRTLTKLQKVKEVKLRECRVLQVGDSLRMESKFRTILNSSPGLQIRHLRISGSRSCILLYWVALIQVDELQSLAVQDTGRLEFPCRWDLSSLLSSREFSSLHSLVVNYLQIQYWDELKSFISHCPNLTMIRIIDMPDVVAINETISIPTLRALHGTANANLLKVVINGTDILQHVHLGVITPQSARECLQALLGKRQALKSLSLTIRVSEGAMYLGIERLVLFPNLKALELGFTSPMHESDFVDNVYDLLSNPVITFPSTLEHFAIKFTSMQGIAWSESLQPLVIDNSWAANFPKLHYLELSEKEGYAVRYDHVRGKMTEEIQLWDDLVKSQLGF